MAGDSKIGPVGGVMRAAPLRKLSSGDTQSAQRPGGTAAPAPETLPTTRLAGMVGQIANQGPPVDVSRVAALRNAIADGSYVLDPDKIANAMTGFYKSAAGQC